MANRVRRHSSEIRDDGFTRRVLGCGIKVHKTLGVGLLESAYETCLALELTKNGFSVVQQVALPIDYDGDRIALAYVPDLVIDNRLIVEVKAVRKLSPVHESQLLTYLKWSGITVGLLMNFHADPLMSGVKRLVWNHREAAVTVVPPSN
ncbi:MAG: GxxExxY protein [Gemmatimonadaceae bacterium]